MSGWDDEEWKPPSAEQLAEIEKRRARSNKISQLMGQYMLKGYRMLDKSCSICGTVLLQTPMSEGGTKYCVGCIDVDGVNGIEQKSNTAQQKPSKTSIHEPTKKLVNKCSLKKTKTQPPKETALQNDPVANFEAQIMKQVKVESTSKTSTIGAGDSQTDIQSLTKNGGDENVERAIRKKLEWAANELENTTQIQYAKDILGFIREGYATLESMK